MVTFQFHPPLEATMTPLATSVVGRKAYWSSQRQSQRGNQRIQLSKDIGNRLGSALFPQPGNSGNVPIPTCCCCELTQWNPVTVEFSKVFSRDSLLKCILLILVVTVNWMGGRSEESVIFLRLDGLIIDDEGWVFKGRKITDELMKHRRLALTDSVWDGRFGCLSQKFYNCLGSFCWGMFVWMADFGNHQNHRGASSICKCVKKPTCGLWPKRFGFTFCWPRPCLLF